MPSVEGFLARYSQLDDEQKAVMEALVMAQARGGGTLQPGAGGRVEGFLARYRQLDDDQKAALRALIMAQRLRFQPQGPSFAAQMLDRHAIQGGEDRSVAPWKSEAKELMGQFREENAARRAKAAAAAAARREEIEEARAQWHAENAARAQAVRRTRDESPPEGTYRMPSAAAEILDRYGAESGEDSSAIPPWKSEARQLMAEMRKESADRSAEVARDRAARRGEVRELMSTLRQQTAQARQRWREESAARSQEVQSFMARLRAERRGEWEGVEVVASAIPSSPTEIRQRK
ncbi:MAG: hypothetical protein ACE5I2_01390 [Anaerolineae bacterium]